MQTVRAMIMLLGAISCAEGVRLRSNNGRVTTKSIKYTVQKDQMCQGQCRIPKDAAECNTAVKDLDGANLLVRAPVETLLGSLKSVGWGLWTGAASFVKEEPLATMEGNEQDMSSMTDPTGCLFYPAKVGKKIYWNAQKNLERPTEDRQLICVCDDSILLDDRIRSISQCGRVTLDESYLDVVRVLPKEPPVPLGEGYAEPTASSYTLKCSKGRSFKGLANSAKRVTITCENEATSEVSIREEGSLEQLTSVPQCQLNRCEYSPLLTTTAVAPGDSGLFNVAFLPDGEHLISGNIPTVHGTYFPMMACSKGHTTDGKPPSGPEDAEQNVLIQLYCDDGEWVRPPGAHSAAVRTDLSGRAVRAVSCTPVRCPTTAHIFTDEHAIWTGETSYVTPVGDATTPPEPLRVQCLEGFVLCAKDESSKTCTAPLAPIYTGMCGEMALWETIAPEATLLEDLTCKPVQCSDLNWGENMEAYVTPTKREDAPEPYIYEPIEASRKAVVVECDKDHSMDGTAGGPTTASFVCSPEGKMAVSSESDDWTHEPEKALCLPKSCVVASVKRHHMFAQVGEEEASVEVEHSAELQLDCEPLWSYTQRGRHTWGESQEQSTYQRTLECEKGHFKCVKGFCGGKVDPTLDEVECAQVRCDTPSQKALDETWKMDMPASPLEARVAGGAKQFLASTNDPTTYTCHKGYMVAGGGEVVRSFTSQCVGDWEDKDFLSGWEPALQPCVLDRNYCKALQFADTQNIKPLSPEDAALREIEARDILLQCKPGHTWNNMDDSRPTDQHTRCEVATLEGGEWRAYRPCEPVECYNPPDGLIYSAVRIEAINMPVEYSLGNGCKDSSSACAMVDQWFTYKCIDGYRWEFSALEARNNAVPATNPTEAKVVCSKTGEYTLHQMDAELQGDAMYDLQGDSKPVCLPLYCAKESQDPWEAMLSGGMAANMHALLTKAYTWTGDDNGWGGRLYEKDRATLLTCFGGDDFNLRCGNSGGFEVNYHALGTGQKWSHVADVGQDLLMACGRELHVASPGNKDINDNQCLTVHETDVFIEPCSELSLKPAQIWRFDASGDECNYWNLESNGVKMHEWEFCGKVRSFKVADNAEAVPMCLAASEADDDKPPRLLPCDSVEYGFWSLDAETHTMRLVPKYLTNNGFPFRAHLYLSVQHTEEGWKVLSDSYFNRQAERGFTYQRPVLSMREGQEEPTVSNGEQD